MRRNLYVVVVLCSLFLCATAAAQSGKLAVPKKAKTATSAPRQKMPPNGEAAYNEANHQAMMSAAQQAGVAKCDCYKTDAASVEACIKSIIAEKYARYQDNEEFKAEMDYTYTNCVRGFVDLGLPSGTYWNKENESMLYIDAEGDWITEVKKEEFYTWDEAVSRFGAKLPSESQWQELIDYCTWSWTGSGYKVVGPNGNSIVLPAAGCRFCNGSVNYVGESGNYWSSTASGSEEAMYLGFNSGGVYLPSDSRCYGVSVRLVQD